MKKILFLPTWQIFILLILPIVFPTSVFGFMLTTVWLALITYCVYLLGRNLYYKLPNVHDLKIKRFNFSMFFSIAYTIIITGLFEGGYNINQDNYKEYGSVVYVVLPLHIFTLYCIFYTIRFIAKAIATIENNKIVGPDMYIGFFLLLWFFPIGVWWMHPKIRKIFGTVSAE